MAATSSTAAYTPIPAVAANKQRQFAKWVEAREVRKTPWTDWMKRRSSPYEQMEIETGQSYFPRIATAIKTQTLNNSASIDVDSTALLSVGDVLKITDYYTGSTTELDPSTTEYATVLSITDSDTVVVNRHQGEVSTGSWAVHPVDSEVRRVARAQSYNTPFTDAVTYRGDLLITHPQRFFSGEITYDMAAIRTPDYESKNHMRKDIMAWKGEVVQDRESAFIEGRKVTGDYSASPKIPYQMMGAIQWAEQGGTATTFAVDGLVNAFTFDDIYREKADEHDLGPGDTVWGSYKTIAAFDTMINPNKGNFGPNDTTITNMVTKVTTRWGTYEPKPAHSFPDGVLLITSKSDWEWAPYIGMDWEYVERGPKELGAMQRSWHASGDFSMTCLDYQRQILMTGIDVRLNLYPGRQVYQ